MIRHIHAYTCIYIFVLLNFSKAFVHCSRTTYTQKSLVTTDFLLLGDGDGDASSPWCHDTSRRKEERAEEERMYAGT